MAGGSGQSRSGFAPFCVLATERLPFLIPKPLHKFMFMLPKQCRCTRFPLRALRSQAWQQWRRAETLKALEVGLPPPSHFRSHQKATAIFTLVREACNDYLPGSFPGDLVFVVESTRH